jgi:hypothetical protein
VSTRPLISAVLCTYNRAGLLRRALDALRGQTLDAEQLEVVVVDDGSTDETRELVSSFKSLLPVRYLFQPKSGLGAAKNLGLGVAQAPIVVFLDDDDVLAGDCLEVHYRTHQEHPDVRTAVLGYTGLAPQVAVSPLMHFVTEVGFHLFSYPQLTDGDLLNFTYFWGGRSSCKRALLLESGTFDPVFRFGCEDIELGYRLSRKGLQVVYQPRAKSYMIRTVDYPGFCHRCYLQGGSSWTFNAMHPAEIVRAWTGVEGIAAEWQRIAPRHPEVIKAGRDLDRLANERVAAGIPLDELMTRLLHRAYYAAFKASRIKGSFDRMVQEQENIATDLSARSSVRKSAGESPCAPCGGRTGSERRSRRTKV